MRTKKAFVPEALGRLESRAVPAPTFYHGVAVLTTNVYQHAVQGIFNSYNIYARNGNAGQLYHNLIQSIRSIPYHHVDGLDNAMLQSVFNLQANLNAGGGPAAILASRTAVWATLNSAINNHVASGQVLFR